MSRVSFLGLGVMGFPMAGHLVRSGHEVCVYNRTTSKAEAWMQRYAGNNQACTAAPSPRAAVAMAELVFICVGGDDDVRALLQGKAGGEDGVLAGLQANAVVVDHTTTSANLARECSALLTERGGGVSFVDAPITGGEKGAQDGKLSVMCGGDDRSYQRALPVINCYAKQCVLMGDSGAGQLSKMVNQICIATILQGLAEGLNFAKRANLDRSKLLTILGSGSAQSWQLDNRAESMCQGLFDFGFATEWMLKDLGFCLQEAEHNGADLAVVSKITGYYKELQALGHRRSDSSALITRLEGKKA